VNSSDQEIYYFSIQYNSYQYGNQIITTLVPTVTVSRTPILEILKNNLGTFLGLKRVISCFKYYFKYSYNSCWFLCECYYY